MKIQGKSVMVTGGAGFIGSHLIDKLILKNPSQLVVVDNFFLGKEKIHNLVEAKENYPELTVKEESVTNQYEMDRILKDYDVNIVFNLAVIPLIASLIKPGWVAHENIKMTLTLCDLLKDGKYEHLVNYSSSEAYGSLIEYPMTENHPLNSTTPYAASKSAGDILALSYWRTFDIPISIIRPFNNYGPRQNEGSYAGVVPITIKNILLGKSPIIHGDGSQTRDYIYVEDTAQISLDLVESGKCIGKALNVAVGVELSINTMIETITKVMEFKGDVEYMPRRIGDVDRHCADVSAIKSILGGLKFTSFTEGIRKTVEYYKEHLVDYKLKESFYNQEIMERILSGKSIFIDS